MTKYTSFEVGYVGDEAGVKVYFDKPVITYGESHTSHHGHHVTKPFKVVTDHRTFSLKTLEEKIKNLPPTDETELDNPHMLIQAKLALTNFIAENGATNPNSDTDWEGVDVYVTPTQTPQP